MSQPKLSFDSLLLVMRILPFKARVICESVCRDWNTASRECTSTYQTSVCIFSRRSNIDKSCIQPFCSDPDHVISFERDCIFAPDPDSPLCVMSILRKCGNLRVLHLKCYEEESLTMEGMESLAYNCPRIEHLSISDDTRGCYIYKDGLTLMNSCDRLAHLQLRFPAESTLDFLIENIILMKSLVRHQDSLTNLSTNLPLNNDNCCFIANECHLERLLLQGTSTTLEGLTMICTAEGQRLHELSILIDWEVQLNLISEFLLHLSCLRCTIANSDITSIKCLSSLKNLKKLFLSVWSSNNLDEDMMTIMNKCRMLESLTVNGEVTDVSLSRVGDLCPQLQRLEVALNTTSITDQTLNQGICRLRCLKHLSLRNCDITDAAFSSLFASLPCLRFVRFSVAKHLSLSVIPVLQDYSARIASDHRKITAVLPQSLFPPAGDPAQRGQEAIILFPNLEIKFE